MNFLKNLFSSNQKEEVQIDFNYFEGLLRNRKKIPVYEYYEDPEYGKIAREGTKGFGLLEYIPTERIKEIYDLHKNAKTIEEKFIQAYHTYNFGDFKSSFLSFDELLKEIPDLFEFLFNYLRICRNVLNIPLNYNEIQIEKDLKKSNYKPTPSKEFKIRCKWCGRYTTFLSPDRLTFGNCCNFCNRMYPSASVKWDSPDGRAYSYFRYSFNDGLFYKEFEEDYDAFPKEITV